MPSPITVTVNFIDLTGNNISGYMTASIVSPSGVYDLFVSGLGIIAPKFSTSGIGTTVSVSVWGNDVVTDMADGLKDTYYTVNLFNTSNVLVWSAAYLFTGTAPVNLVGYPSLTVVPAPPSSFVPVLAIGGVNTDVQSNQGGSLYGDAGFTYNFTTQSVGGAQGLFVTATLGSGTFSVAVANVGTPGAVEYDYAVVARKGIAEISIGTNSTFTGNAVLTSGNYNSISWAAVPGATSYDVYVYGNSAATLPSQLGFLGNTASLFYRDIGTAPALPSVAPPNFPENGFLNISNGLNVQNSNYQTLQSHFGDSLGMLDFYLGNETVLSITPPVARNEFITAGPGRLVDTVNMPVMSVLSSNGPNSGLVVANTVRNNIGTTFFSQQINASVHRVHLLSITSTEGATGVFSAVNVENCNITGSSIDYDHGSATGSASNVFVDSFSTACHIDAAIGSAGEVTFSATQGFPVSIIEAIGVFGTISYGGDLVAGSVNTITNGYGFKSGPINATSNTLTTITNYYNYFASVPNPNFDTNFTVTNSFGFYSKNQTPRNNTPTLQSAFYAEDQGNNTGAWAYFSAGTTPSQLGGPLKMGGIALPVVTKTANYSTLITDYMVLMNAAGATTVTLLTTGIPVGKIYTVKNINTGTVTVVGQTGNIDNAANFSIPTQYASASFQWDGSKWWIS